MNGVDIDNAHNASGILWYFPTTTEMKKSLSWSLQKKKEKTKNMRNKVNRNSSENWSISVCARVHHCTKPRAKSQEPDEIYS